MSKIVWDATGERFWETGIDHGVLYRLNQSGVYANGYAWNGLTSVSESPEGADATDLWADNIKYASIRAAETFGGTIEAYTYPDEFAECDGSAALTTGVHVHQQKRERFGLCYRTKKGNDITDEAGYILHLVYGCTASPSEKSYETINDSPDAITFSWEFDTVPVNVANLKPTSLITIDTTKLDQTGLEYLAVLEDVLYGRDASEGSGSDPAVTALTPRLPLPDEVKTIMTTGQAAA